MPARFLLGLARSLSPIPAGGLNLRGVSFNTGLVTLPGEWVIRWWMASRWPLKAGGGEGVPSDTLATLSVSCWDDTLLVWQMLRGLVTCRSVAKGEVERLVAPWSVFGYELAGSSKSTQILTIKNEKGVNVVFTALCKIRRKRLSKVDDVKN